MHKPLGMFEQVVDPVTGETFTPTSGRGHYTNVNKSFPTTHCYSTGIQHDRAIHEYRVSDPYYQEAYPRSAKHAP